MIRVFDILVPVIASGMSGNQLMIMIETDPVGECLHCQSGAGVFSRHGIAVGVEGDSELLAGPDLEEGPGVVG